MADPKLVEQFYNKFNEDNRLNTRHGRVEFEVTMTKILECVEKLGPKKSKNYSKIKIADIGAGTGNYSVPLSQKGFDVTAVELVKRNLDILRSKHENIKTWQGNALDLHFLPKNKFDITLLFGPMYHFHDDNDKIKALNEAKRITKKGGFILVSYLLKDYSIITYCFKEHKIKEVMEKGGITENWELVATDKDLFTYETYFDVTFYGDYCDLKRIKIVAPDGAADYMRRELNEMSEEEFELFIQYQKAMCEKITLYGASSHLIDILQK